MIDKFDIRLICDNRFEKFIDFQITKYFHKSKRWKNCVRLFCHDFIKIDVSERIIIKNCRARFYLYQIFKMFVMFEMKIFTEKKYNFNNINLKKICDLMFRSKWFLILTNWTNRSNVKNDCFESRFADSSWSDERRTWT